METLNDAEEFVYKVCKQSFLSLWSYANPQGKDGSKELCDILVVCEPDIIIFSVKDIKLGEGGDESVNHERWRKRAVEASAKQIYGAERYLQSASQITRRDGTPGLPLSKEVTWRFHRVAVALGSQGKVPFWFGDLGKGYVHVFDEQSFSTIVQELDTISDFVNYLLAKEQLTQRGVTILFEGAEEDLLAFYLHQGREFPKEPDMLVISENLWDSLTQRSEFTRRREADRQSYIWDGLIEEMCMTKPNNGTGADPSLTDTELAVRIMARENRFSRRVLSKSYVDFLEAARAGEVKSRMVQSLTPNVAYTFLHVPHGEDRELREAELGHRCFITRGTIPNCTTVVGLSTEDWKEGVGCYSYMCYLHKPTWTDEDQTHMEDTKQKLGFFAKARMGRVREDEYPAQQRQTLFDRLTPMIRNQPYVKYPKIGRNELCPCGSGKKYKRCHGLVS